VFTKPLPVASTRTLQASGMRSGGLPLHGGSPHMLFEMDSLSPLGRGSTGSSPHQISPVFSAIPTELTSGGSYLNRFATSRAANSKSPDHEYSDYMPMNRSSTEKTLVPISSSLIVEEEAPYLDMTLLDNNTTQPTIISEESRLSLNTTAQHNLIVRQSAHSKDISTEKHQKSSNSSQMGDVLTSTGSLSVNIPCPVASLSTELILSRSPAVSSPPPEVSEPALNYLEFEPGSKTRGPRPTNQSIMQEQELYARLYGPQGPPMSTSIFAGIQSRFNAAFGLHSGSQLPQVPEHADDEENETQRMKPHIAPSLLPQSTVTTLNQSPSVTSEATQ